MANDRIDTTGSDWADVTRALDALGASISKAAQGAVDDVENRRRMRELADGLAALARSMGVTVDRMEVAPAVVETTRVASRAADTVLMTAEDAAECVVDNVPPEVLSAIEAANAKFRQAAEQWAEPSGTAPTQAPAAPDAGEQATEVLAPAPAPTAPAIVIPEEPAGVTGAIGVIGGRVASLFGGAHAEPEPAEEGEQSISDWLFPEGEPAVDDALPPTPPLPLDEAVEAAADAQVARESEPASAAPELASEESAAAAGEPQPAAGIDAVRIAHERFLAERKIAEEAAAASREHAAQAPHKPSRSRRQAPPSDDASLW